MENGESDFPLPPRGRRKPLQVLPGGGAVPLPHSLEAERALLGCCLLDPVVMVPRCKAARLTRRAFYLEAHALVWEKIDALDQAGRQIDLAIVAEELKRNGELDGVGYSTLTELLASVPTTMQAGYWLDTVVAYALRRSAIREAQAVMAACHDTAQDDVTGMLGGFALKAQRLADYAARRGRVSLRERLTKRHAQITAELAGKVDKSRWLHTGLTWLDACLLPFDVRQEDWYVIVGGPPSGGKSSVMRHVAVHNADMGKRGVVFLLETGLRWIDQAAASHAKVNLREKDQWLRERRVNFDKRYQELIGYAEDRLWVFEDLVFVEDIERQLRALDRMLREKDLAAGKSEEEAHGLDFAIVDYLQIVGTRQNFRGHREQTLAHVSMTLKRCFRSLDITGFVGAQINRASREDPAKPPTLAALRESGAIEQDADRVLFVHTPPTNRAGQSQDGNNLVDEVDIIQRKSRNGPRDVSVTVNFFKTFTRYEEAVRKGDLRPGVPKPPGGYKREGNT